MRPFDTSHDEWLDRWQSSPIRAGGGSERTDSPGGADGADGTDGTDGANGADGSADRFASSPIDRRQFVRLSAATAGALALPGNASAAVSAAEFTDEYAYVLNHTPADHAVPTLVQFSDATGPDAMDAAVDGEVITTREPEPAAYARLTATQASTVADLPEASNFQFTPGSNPFWRIGYYPLGVFPEPRRAVDYIGFEQMKDGVRELEARYPERVRVKNVGQSPGHHNNATDRPDPKGMYVVELTNFDSATDFEDKEKVFFSCSLHGPEEAGRETGARVIENVARGSEPDIEGNNAKVEPLLDDVVVIIGFVNPDGWVARNPQYDSDWQFDFGDIPFAPLYERGNAEVYDTNRQYPSVGYIVPPPGHYPAEPAEGNDAPNYLHEKVPDAAALVDFFRAEYDNLGYGADLHGGPVFNEFVLGLISQNEFDTRQLHELYEMCLVIDNVLEQALETWVTAGDIKKTLVGDFKTGLLFGVLPEQAFDYGTIYDTIDYTVSGAFLDWLAQPEITDADGNVVGGGLGATTLDFEMSFSWAVNGQYYNPELEEMKVTGYRTAIRTITAFAVRNSDTPRTDDGFDTRTVTSGDDVAYVTTGTVGTDGDALRRTDDDLVLTTFETIRELSYSGVIGPGGPGTTTAEHTFETDAAADRVEATLSWAQNVQDNDFFLEDENGDRIAGSTNFGGPERIQTSIEGGKSYTFVVETYINGAADYEIEGSTRSANRQSGDGSTSDGSTSGGFSGSTAESTVTDRVAGGGVAAATHEVGASEDLHSMTVLTRAPTAVFDLELRAPDGTVVREFEGVTEERAGGANYAFPEWTVSEPESGTWTLRVENRAEAPRPFEIRFGTLQSGDGATIPDPKAVVGYEQRPYDVTPFRFFEEYGAFVEDGGSVEPVTVAEVEEGALAGYDHAVIIHDYLPDLTRASSGATDAGYTGALDDFVDAGGNLVLTDTGAYLLPLLDNGLVAGGAIDREEDVVRRFDDVGQFEEKNLDHPLFGTEGDVRPIQDQLWKVAPLGFAVSGEAPLDLVDEDRFALAAEDAAGVPSVAGRAADRVAAGSITESANSGRGVHVVSSLLPPASQSNLHPFGLLNYTTTFLGYVVLTSTLGFEQVRNASGTERRYGRGDTWQVDPIEAPAPEFSVTGSRSDDGSTFTAGQTDQIDLAITPSDESVVRDIVPPEWTVLEEYSDPIERVETADGRKYVYFGETAAANEQSNYTYFVEAPDETGSYEFGPIEVNPTVRDRFVTVSGTSETNYVAGVST